MTAVRLFDKPIITPGLCPSLGTNINGSSLIKVPDWITDPLGRYYLYFAHHTGHYIRLAYADTFEGPWRIHEPGTLRLEQAPYLRQAPGGHIASPDVHIDHAAKQIVMYHHGLIPKDTPRDPTVTEEQGTYAAVSHDGLTFCPVGGLLGNFYWRVFPWDGYHYAIEMSGRVRRSRDGLTGFEAGPVLKRDWVTRHMAVLRDGATLYVFFSIKGDCPERIVVSTIDLSKDWFEWRESPHTVLLEPERDYEGGHLPLVPSQNGLAADPVRQLRDPAIYQEDGKTYLLYSIAGESGIAMARIKHNINR